jgi:RHS repeat-associated protein
MCRHGVPHSAWPSPGVRGSVARAARRVVGSRLLRGRFPSARTLTTHYDYTPSSADPDGAFLASETTPDGVSTSYGYDNLGEQTSVTDGAADTTRYAYDYLGDRTKVTYPDQTSTRTDYNSAQLPTQVTQFDHTGKQLTQTGQVYDADGNVLASYGADQSALPAGSQHPTTFTYDATGMVTQEVQPVDATTSVTTGFGYDADGNRTRYTDGNQKNWYTTYNSLGLPETTVEPQTDTYTSAADSTTTFSYNGDGRPTKVVQPGGVETDLGYDKLGNILNQSGSGADAATAARTFTYDADSRVKTAGTASAGTPGQPGYQPATNEGFGYDDRGDLLTATGDAGAGSFSYTGDGLMASRTDAAGTTSYTYDSADRLKTLDDPATGTSLTYGYDADSQLHTVQYGGSGQLRTYGYNDSHELTGDTLVQGSATMASITYGYDDNGNLTSKDTTGFTGASDNTYTYDWANRLTSWDNGSTNTAYGYDGNGNRTRVGADVYTYDARDELTSDGVNSYAYSARGTMTRQTAVSGTQNFTTDAYGQQITAGTQTYGLDAAGRVLTDTSSLGGTQTLRYSGTDNTVAQDGSYTYSYDPDGGLIGINNAGATGTTTGRLAFTDQHTDVVGTFAPGATSLAGSTTYDPLGNVTASSSPFGQLGFQSGWTDPATGRIDMVARWYDPASGQFGDKDTFAADPVPDAADANPFAYVGDNPLGDTDPSGHCGWLSVSCYAHAAAHKISHAAKRVAKAAVHVYHKAAKVIRRVVHVARRVVRHTVHVVHDVYRATVRTVHRVYAYAARHVRRAYHAATHYVKTAYHEAKHVVKRVVHAAAHAARTAYHATVKAVKTAAKFAKHHAAAIASFVASTAVFAGCEALTAGVGSIGCAAAAGAVGGLVEQGFKCADAGGSSCSLSSFAGAAIVGGVAGALGGALGSLGGKLLSKVLPKALEAVGGLFGKGLADAAEDGAADATDVAAEEAASDSAASSTANGPAKAESSGAGGGGGDEPDAGTEGEGGSCSAPTHSFTGGTRVLMADGASRSIDEVRVGDEIRDAVPGRAGTEVHKVEKVIVTHTDHDFVDVTVAPVKSAGPGGGHPVLRKAALGLAASVAAFTAVLGVGGHHAAEAAVPVPPHATSAHVSGAHATGAVRGSGVRAAGVAGSGGRPGRAATLTTTFHHPFYDVTRSAFVEAQHLRAGDLLQSTTGEAEVTAVHLYHANTTTYDLTIDGLHTYYVVAGGTPILVHNTNSSCEIPLYRSPAEGKQASEANGLNAANHGGSHPTAYLSNMPEGAAQYAGNGHDPGFHVFAMKPGFMDAFGDLEFPLENKNGLQGVTEFRIPADRFDEFNSYIDHSQTRWVPAYQGWWDEGDLG